MVDREAMRAFITGILGDMQGNAVLSVATGRNDPTEKNPQGKLKVEEHHWFAYPAELEGMIDFALKERPGDKRNTYISPLIYGDRHAYDQRSGKEILTDREGRPTFSRAKGNALYAQTIYMDSDACPPERFRVPPSRHVQTSEGHGHDYWMLPDPIPASMAAEIAHRITTAHRADGSDPSGWVDNKILRLPTFNTSYDNEHPFVITWHDTGEIYNEIDISAAYDDVVVDAIPSGTLGDISLPPVPEVEGLPDAVALLERIPASNHRLHDLLFKEPKLGDSGWRSEQLYALMLDLRRFGFTDVETLALAWASPASGKYKTDARGIAGLWWEIQVRVNAVIADERGESIEAAPPKPERGSLGPKLLTADERARVANRSDLHTLYLAHARSRVQVFNGPYHQMNGWLMHAVTLGDTAMIPTYPKAMPCGLYTFQVGPSGSGKTGSQAILFEIINQVFPDDTSPFYAARTSKEALIEHLIDRDGRTTYFYDPEADGILKEMRSNGPMSGVIPLYTSVYDGDVPPLGRVGRRELNVVGRTTNPVLNFVGTPKAILEQVDKEMYYSGFMARVIWVISDDVVVDEDSTRTKFGKVERDPMAKWWAAHLHMLRRRALADLGFGERKATLVPTDEAHERIDKAKWNAKQHFQEEYDFELWQAILNRMGDVIWKIAGLRALSAGRTIIGLRDAEVAIAYAEMWLGNAAQIASQISDTYFSQQCDDIERFIGSQPARTAPVSKIYTHRRGERIITTNEYLDSLVKQGRLSMEQNGAGSPTYYTIKEKKS